MQNSLPVADHAFPDRIVYLRVCSKVFHYINTPLNPHLMGFHGATVMDVHLGPT